MAGDMKKQIFLIHHGTYPFDVLVAVAAPVAEIRAWLKRHRGVDLTEDECKGLEIPDGPGKAYTLMLDGGATILRVSRTRDTAQFHSVVAHELFHCVEFLFYKIGLKYDNGSQNNEAFAYQIGHLTQQFYAKFTGHRRLAMGKR